MCIGDLDVIRASEMQKYTSKVCLHFWVECWEVGGLKIIELMVRGSWGILRVCVYVDSGYVEAAPGAWNYPGVKT